MPSAFISMLSKFDALERVLIISGSSRFSSLLLC